MINVWSISNHSYLLLSRYPIKAKIAHVHLTVVKQLPYINDFATCMNWNRQIDTTNTKQMQIDSYTTWCKFYVHRMFLLCLQIKCGCTHFLLKLPTQFHLSSNLLKRSWKIKQICIVATYNLNGMILKIKFWQKYGPHGLAYKLTLSRKFFYFFLIFK